MAEDNGEQNQGGLFDAPQSQPAAPLGRFTADPPSALRTSAEPGARPTSTKGAELHALIDQHLPTGPTAWVSEEKLNSILKAVVSAL
jgi:hypothetical protein